MQVRLWGEIRMEYMNGGRSSWMPGLLSTGAEGGGFFDLMSGVFLKKESYVYIA
jgi:hypothetical protein